jgi:Leucine-rich repeat (LRR) protein
MISFGQNVNIPDANFKNYLVNNSGINTNGDSEIQVSEASVFTGQINCSSQSISDLKGIESFTALTYLKCSNNELKSLDVSSNTALIYLKCSNKQLTSLNVSNNTALTELYCESTQLNCVTGVPVNCKFIGSIRCRTLKQD